MFCLFHQNVCNGNNRFEHDIEDSADLNLLALPVIFEHDIERVADLNLLALPVNHRVKIFDVCIITDRPTGVLVNCLLC